MARMEQLSALKVSRTKRPGRYGDGGGLYLQITPAGSKSWLFRYKIHGKTREMGLGPLHAVSLKDARAKATDCRRLRASGFDPIETRNAETRRARLEAARSISFRACCDAYIAAHESSWRNPKHRQQWRNTLSTYVYGVFGDLPVQAVDVALVVKALEPIWRKRPETASRLRGRIEAVLDWAKAREYRQGENPARWRGHLDMLLPGRPKVSRVEHHPALPYLDVNEFLAELRTQQGIAARALELLILTATRTSEVINATWSEFDLNGKVWAIPAERMKAGKEHRVPLSDPALALLREMAEAKTGDHVFAGVKKGKPLSNMAMLKLLERMSRDDLTVHGFRSTFRDWAAERTSFAREVAEAALAHSVGDKVEAAYRRGDLFEKRHRLMDAWAKHCETRVKSGDVLQIGAAAAR